MRNFWAMFWRVVTKAASEKLCFAQERANNVRMPTVARSLAANWGQPSSAPAIPAGGKEIALLQRAASNMRAAADEKTSTRARTESYAKKRSEQMFGI